jgi:hypothetical protein
MFDGEARFSGIERVRNSRFLSARRERFERKRGPNTSDCKKPRHAEPATVITRCFHPSSLRWRGAFRQ